MLLGWLELVVLALIPYLFAPPDPSYRNGYCHLFQTWSRAWVHALGAALRLQEKNHHPPPAQYRLIANNPSAFEDSDIPAWFDVDNLTKIRVRDEWILGRIAAAAAKRPHDHPRYGAFEACLNTRRTHSAGIRALGDGTSTG
jgi:hypothetical protein